MAQAEGSTGAGWHLRREADDARPLTRLHAVIQKWRATFVGPVWTVEPAWAANLVETHGGPTRLVPHFRTGRLRIEVDPGLSDAEAEAVLLLTLTRLQMAELRLQSRHRSLPPGQGRTSSPLQGRRHGDPERPEPDWAGHTPKPFGGCGVG